MFTPDSRFSVREADGPESHRAAQRLRYDVFVRELGGQGGSASDHDAGLERDRFDAHCRHLLLFDTARDDGAPVGVYRLMGRAEAEAAGGFYSAGEYDLAPLLDSGRRLLELGRSCLRPEYRGTGAMFHLWAALAALVARENVEVLFGTASFPGTDLGALAQPLSLLHHRHLAPPPLRVRAQGGAARAMDLLPEPEIDRRAAVVAMPALIKAYLRLGGCVGAGAYVDHGFGCTDVCMILEADRIPDRQKTIYEKGLA